MKNVFVLLLALLVGLQTEGIAQTSPNTVLSGPSSGGSAAATYRSLVTADLPTPFSSFTECVISSAATVDIGANCVPGQLVSITGNVTITSLGSTAPVGAQWNVFFPAALTITNGSSLHLPNNANIVTLNGGGTLLTCYVPQTIGTWYCTNTLFTPNMNFVETGSIQIASGGTYIGGGVNLTGSGIQPNGFNLVASNSVGFYTVSTEAGRIDASQRWLLGFTADQGGGENVQVNGSVYASSQLKSNIATGTPPLVVASTTRVANLNAATAGVATSANGLNSATTTVAVSAATAPIAGQVLTATSGTAANWAALPALAPAICTLASAATTDLGTCPNGSIVTVTGTTNITSLGSSAPAGSGYYVLFSGSLTLTQGTNLQLPGGGNVGTGTGNPILFCEVPATAGTWYCSNPLYSANSSITPNGTGNFGNINVTAGGVPADGIYKPATNTLGFASNNTAAGTVDSTQHWRLGGSGTPTIGANACGSTTQGTIGAGSTDRSGLLTVGTTGVTSCVVSFASTWGIAPRHVSLTPANATAAATGTTGAYVSAVGTTSFTVTGLALAGAAYYYLVE